MVSTGVTNAVMEIRRDAIEPDSEQPRKHFDGEKLQELAHSMENMGQRTPIEVRPHLESTTRNRRYIIIAGERRWRAAGLLGWETMRAIVYKDISAKDAVKSQLLENIVREDLNPVEEAEAMKKLLDEGYTWQELAATLGKPTMHVYCNTTMLEARPEAVELVRNGTIAPRACYEISQLSHFYQGRVLQAIASKGLTYPDILALCQRFKGVEDQTELTLEMPQETEQLIRARASLGKTLGSIASEIVALLNLEDEAEGCIGQALDGTVIAKLDECVNGLQKVKRLARQHEVLQAMNE